MQEQMTIGDLKKLPQISLPFKCQESTFVLSEMHSYCPDCGGKIDDFRGKIYESFGVLEIDGIWVCYPCRMVIKNRSRVNSKRRIMSQLIDGRWVDFPMKTINQIWFEKSLRILIPLWTGGLVGIGLARIFIHMNRLGCLFCLGCLFSGSIILILTLAVILFEHDISRK